MKPQDITQPGHYWFRRDSDQPWTMAEVWDWPNAGLHFVVPKATPCRTASHLACGFFYGPIQPPTDADVIAWEAAEAARQDVAEEDRRTWREWDEEHIDGLRIYDPDGFRDRPSDTLYSRSEFIQTRTHSTVMGVAAKQSPDTDRA